MTRADLLALLVRAVQDGWLTEDQALDYMRRFHAGELQPADLPLPLSEAIQGVDRERDKILLSAALALLLTHLPWPLPDDRPAALLQLRTLRLGPRIDIADRLQTLFEQDARALARQLAAGDLALPEWQGQFRDRIRQNLVEQMLLGAGGELTPAQMARLDQLARTETAYLSRFADQLTVTVLDGKPLSEPYIGMRSALYGGNARGAFFQTVEETERARGGFSEPGWVVFYVAIGDQNTCLPCQQAVGYYLPVTGPMPGQICLGRSRCRCRRLWVMDPVEYDRLML